ncbi:MAG: DUF4112 domain-containing protein [Alistipes sp.]|nr:DUF4112 domain-containing protein [Alistipes sp.]
MALKTDIVKRANRRKRIVNFFATLKGRIESHNQSRKQNRAERLKNSTSFAILEGTRRVMDDLIFGIGLDPFLGFLPAGSGDIISSITALPSIYVALFKVRSIPLTLAVIKNMLVDMLVGAIPMLGNVLDFFYRSHHKNYQLIVDYIEGDKQTIEEVNRGAWFMAILILIISTMIYFAIKLLSMFWDWIVGLF